MRHSGMIRGHLGVKRPVCHLKTYYFVITKFILLYSKLIRNIIDARPTGCTGGGSNFRGAPNFTDNHELQTEFYG